MQISAGIDEKGIYYEFIYLEKINRIIVLKKNKGKLEPFYVMKVLKKGFKIELDCECWGHYWFLKGRNKQDCRHIQFVKDEFKFNKRIRPRDWLKKVAEEYYENWVTMRIKLKGD